MNIVIAKQLIEKAIKDHMFLRFDYVKQDLEISAQRNIYPYELKDKGVIGWDFTKQGLRNFDFEGIQRLVIYPPQELYNTKEEK